MIPNDGRDSPLPVHRLLAERNGGQHATEGLEKTVVRLLREAWVAVGERPRHVDGDLVFDLGREGSRRILEQLGIPEVSVRVLSWSYG